MSGDIAHLYCLFLEIKKQREKGRFPNIAPSYFSTPFVFCGNPNKLHPHFHSILFPIFLFHMYSVLRLFISLQLVYVFVYDSLPPSHPTS